MVLEELRHFADSLKFTLQRCAEEQEGKRTGDFGRSATSHQGDIPSGIIPNFHKCVLFMLMAHLPLGSGVNISADVGHSVLLPCQSDPHEMEDANVYWQKLPGDHVVLYYWKGKEHPENQHSRYWNRAQMDNAEFPKGNLSLTLQGVTLNDTGVYQCIIKKKQHVTAEKYLIRLTVNEPPENVIDNKSSDTGVNISADVGHSVLLPCQSDPHQMDDANVYWQKVPGDVLYYWKGKERPENQHPRYWNRTQMDNAEFIKGNLSLTLRGVTLNDTGVYQCIIKKKQHVTAEKYLIRLTVNEIGTRDRHHFVLIASVIVLVIFICIITSQPNPNNG